MANLIELEQWEEGIYQLETDDPVLGGEDGIDNLQAKQLANRTQYLLAQLLLRATINSPEFTGTPKVPTAAPGTNNTQAASTAFTQAAIDAAIAGLIDTAPGALDTLNELAAALGDDPNFATTITNALALKAPLENPVFTGNPQAPTPAPGDSDLSIATTEFVQAAIAAGLSPDASETVKGLIEIATDAEAQAFAANKAIDGAKLDSAFKGSNQALSNSGYQKLPGGLIIQWMRVGDGGNLTTDHSAQYSFPVSFPNACFCLVGTLQRATVVSGGWTTYVNIDNQSQFTFVWELAAGTSNTPRSGYIIAIGF